MGIPLRQQLAIALYVVKQKLKGNARYPLVLMLEPLFRCNLACAGCGKIDYPEEILNRRVSVADALAAVDECGAPVISIAGGEPLLHKELPAIVQGMIARRKFVYLCTNALLLKKRMDDYTPSPYLTFSIHLDGNRDRHDASVCQSGVYERAVEAVKAALARGFRVTVNCTLFQGETAEEVGAFFDEMTALGVEGITVSPGFSYEHAPRQDVFLQRSATKNLFRQIFKLGQERRRRWSLNHSSLYLDFLAGNRRFNCTAWGNPTYNVFGWQKPCYLLVDEGYAKSYGELLTQTDWSRYGSDANPKCANCMAHCGYEPSAVEAAFRRPWSLVALALRGIRTSGPFAPEAPPRYSEEAAAASAEVMVPVASLTATRSANRNAKL